MSNSTSVKSYTVTLLLALILGYLGAHRFYAGKVGTGVLFLFTGGFFVIGWIIDILTVAFGNFTDKSGQFIRPIQKERESRPVSEPIEAGKKKTPIWVWIVIGVLVLAGLGSIVGGDENDSTETQVVDATESAGMEPAEVEPDDDGPSNVDTVGLSEAFCNDLSEGLSLFQLYEGGLEGGSYDTPEEFADLAYGFAWMSCPDQLEENEGLRDYLQAWGIDPDTGGLYRGEADSEPEEASSPEVCEEGKLGNMWVLLEEEGCIDPWPLTSKSGILYCDPYGEGLGVVVWNPDEDPLEFYALNGMALGQGFPDIEPFWKDTPAGSPAPKVNIGAMIDAGLSLCD